MFLNVQVKHISAKQNGIADYLARLLSITCGVPDYLHLLRTYKSTVGVFRVVEEDRDNMITICLAWLIRPLKIWNIWPKLQQLRTNTCNLPHRKWIKPI